MRRTVIAVLLTSWTSGCSFSLSAIAGDGPSGDDGPDDDSPGGDGPNGDGQIADAPGDGPLPVNGVPGGVITQPIWWLAADHGLGALADTAPVTTWMDRSVGNHNAVAASPGEQPSWRAATFNFNPAIEFTNDRLVVPSGVFGTATYPALSLFVVFADDTNTTFDWMLHEGINGLDRFSISRSYMNSTTTDVDATTANRVQTSALVPATLLSATWSTTAIPRIALYLDGTLGQMQTSYTPFVGVGAHMQIGDNENPIDAPNSPFDGRIAEIYLVAANLTAAERMRIESSLALEHGISLSHNYVASDGTVVWPNTGGFSNDIAGIGRDPAADVDQRQSRSGDGRALVTIGVGTIAASNAANPATIADGAFLVWGNDNAALAWQTTEKPTTVARRLTREWRAIETGAIGSVRVRVPDSTSAAPEKLPAVGAGGVVMLVDTDSNFGTGALLVPMMLVGGAWEADLDLAGTSYFTFAELP